METATEPSERPREVFIDFAVAGNSDHMPSSGQKLELHLQVAVLLPDAIPLILLGAVDFRDQKPGIIQEGGTAFFVSGRCCRQRRCVM